MDIWYVQNASLTLDLVVLARTVRTVLLGERADGAAVGEARQALARGSSMMPGYSEAAAPAAGPASNRGERRRVA